MTTTTDAPDVVLARLEDDFATRPTDEVGQRIVDLRSALTLLENVEPKLAQLSKWRADQEAWRKALADELFELPSPIRTAQDRSRYRDLELSIRTLDAGLRVLDDTGVMLEDLRLGALMRASGLERNLPAPAGEMGLRLPWLGSIPEVERRIRELQERCGDAQARLDAALHDSS
jgi:hypothetical protein